MRRDSRLARAWRLDADYAAEKLRGGLEVHADAKQKTGIRTVDLRNGSRVEVTAQIAQNERVGKMANTLGWLLFLLWALAVVLALTCLLVPSVIVVLYVWSELKNWLEYRAILRRYKKPAGC